MAWTLDTPQTTTVTSCKIQSLDIDLQANAIYVQIEDLDANDDQVKLRTAAFPIYDDFGNLISPSNWPEGYINMATLYGFMKAYLYMRLRDVPGALEDGELS